MRNLNLFFFKIFEIIYVKNHNIKNSRVLIFFLFLNSFQLTAQSEENSANNNFIPNITVAPPQVAAMAKVGEIPIDIATGRMNYNIPIFEIKEGNFSMPINLSYNYSGLILDEVPGYAGVGWTFNIGGSILHSINGLDDTHREYQKEWVYNYINKLPPYDDPVSPSGLTRITNYLANISNGVFDGEPDKYIVNAGNLNCSFYLDKDNNAIFLNNEKYKVSGYSHTGFTITDSQGVNYIFNIPLDVTKSSGLDSYDYISSFLLTEINFPTTTNKILFEYENDSKIYNDIQINETLVQFSTEYTIQNSEIIKNKTFSGTFTSKLKKITTNNYTIELQFNNNPTDLSIAVISNLTVKDNSKKTVRNYDFTYSPWVGKRTNLLNVKYNGVITNEMEYDMSIPYPVTVPEKDYAKKDLWGYYNAKGTPAKTGITTPQDNPEIKPDFDSTKIGALKKITYQTKGYSLIEYEPNNVYMERSEYNFPYDSDGTVTSYVNAGTMARDNLNIDEETFSIDVSSTVKLSYNFTNHTQYAPMMDRDGNEISIYQDSNLIFNKKLTWLWEQRWIPSSLIISDTKELYLRTPGTYRIKAFSVMGASAGLTITLKKTDKYFNQTVGGIRVKQIKNCDFNGECITTVYNYSQEGKSTGILLQSPQFYSGYHIQDNDCTPKVYVRRDFYNYTSIYPLSNFRGSPVLYKRVEKTDFGKDKDKLVSNGKTIFNYSGNSRIANSIYDLESQYETGLLTLKEIKNNQNNKIKSENNNYKVSPIPNNTKFLYFLNCKIVRERRVNISGPGGISGSGCAPIYPRPLIDFQIFPYKYQPKNYVLRDEKHTNYYKDSLTQTIVYDYNLEGQINSRKNVNSNQETFETKYFYPQDPEMVSEPFAKDLKAANIIGTPLVTQNFKNLVKLSEQKTSYEKNVSTNNLLLPKYIYANKGTGNINISTDKKIIFDQYDDKGNILQYTPENGSPISIIWGYGQTQPIAKIENALYSDLSGYVSNLQTKSDITAGTEIEREANLIAALNALRTALPNAMVTTYTYKPLIGVSTITDPKGFITTYTYDSFGRLETVKDNLGNILSEN
ncbi:YD repeat-containing protein, partial [Flavobacterium defluvii]